MKRLRMMVSMTALLLLSLLSCEREPPLHLHRGGDIGIAPIVDLDLDVYWDYVMGFEEEYDWQKEWYYGWDSIDAKIFGRLEYSQPSIFNIRRYMTKTPDAPHTSVLRTDEFHGTLFRATYDFGFWDILAWNDLREFSPILSLVIDEDASLEYVSAYTHMTNSIARYGSKYSRSFYQPELLFSGYMEDMEINRNYDGFVQMLDEETGKMYWYKRAELQLTPCTYIYLTQVILHHNNGRITSVDGSANLSGMSRSVNLNTGVTGPDEITVHYDVRMKRNCDMDGENVDIVGGRLQTFGMCNLNPNLIRTRAENASVKVREADHARHYIDLEMQFSNGMDSIFVFDVTEQVQQRFRGGVLTVELDIDTVPMPRRSGGSAFDAVVVDYEDGGTHEFEMAKKRKAIDP